MTSDAKIGLLLGLVFIVIIAFLINGLPEMVTGQSANTSAISVEKIDDILSIDHNADQAIKEIEELYTPATRIVEETAMQNDPRFSSDGTVVAHNSGTSNIVLTTNSGREYVIQSGDNLAKIAKKVYGSDQGNRHANIQKIFKANSDRLDSPDDIFQGQKIIIPALTSVSQRVVVPNNNPAPEMLLRVKRGINNVINRKPKYSTYTVKEGDSMWQIAQKYLGDGNRYREILKLNKSLISDSSEISPGMKLKIPAK